MDSVSQLVLGAAVSAACVPARHRRKALLLGAALGTLPDLDVLIDYGDAVSNMRFHRGFSHSLFVLPVVALLRSCAKLPSASCTWPIRVGRTVQLSLSSIPSARRAP